MARRTRTPKWLKVARQNDWGAPAPGEKPQWLARALSRAGHLDREQAEQAIRNGRVTLGGRVVREPLALLRPGDEVRLDGKPLELEAPTLVLMFHKPAGVIVSGADPQQQGTVFDLFRPLLDEKLSRYGWHAVGRLDRDTTGLLLFTNDELFVSYATRPEHHLPKRYLARVSGTPTDERLEPLRHGIELDDGPAKPAKAVIRGPSQVELTISEGRFHQVKRMLAAVGLPVRQLHREAIGEVALDIPEGALRQLTEGEIRDGLRYPPPPARR